MIASPDVTLRPAAAGDADMVFGWRNDPFLVERASSQKCVTREEHVRWFQETIAGASRKMFIVVIHGVAAGQIRFERIDAETCSISVYVLERYTGRGFGVEAIRQGCAIVKREWPVSRLLAYVRQDNVPSQIAFRKAGFEISESNARPNHVTLVSRRVVEPAAAVATP
jgi:RimJ/RimL family protein N-acetyltransferase